MRALLTILIILLFLFSLQGLVAQSMVGFSGGYISSVPFRVDTDAHFTEHYKPRGGYSISVFLRKRRERAIDFVSALIYSVKSYEDKSVFGGLGITDYHNTNDKLNHIGIGTFAEYSMERKARFHVGAGLVLQYFLYHMKTGTIKTVTGGRETIRTYNGKVEIYDHLDMRATLRLGFEFPISPQIDIVLDQSYSMGLLGYKTKDFMLQLGLQYQIAAKHEK